MRLLAVDATVEVVGVAEDGAVALERMAEVAPDLVLLDIEMPTMDGISFLREMRRRRVFIPVLVFSSLSRRGALVTVEALSAGASDYVTKPGSTTVTGDLPRDLREVLLEKIHTLGKRAPRHRDSELAAKEVAAPALPIAPVSSSRRIEVVVIGVSTGGPQALNDILQDLPGDLGVPILIVQHMPRLFTEQLARTLSNKCRMPVSEAKHHEPVIASHILIAPGGQHMRVRRDASGVVRVILSDEAPVRSCRPSVDLLFESAAATYGNRVLGVVLTGMGNDGLTGSQAIRGAGGDVYAQDEQSSVVWGMPGEVVKAGLATKIIPLPIVATEITRRIIHARRA